MSSRRGACEAGDYARFAPDRASGEYSGHAAGAPPVTPALRRLAAAACALLATPVSAAEFGPFAAQNLTPFVQNAGIPLPEPVPATGVGATRWALVLDGASHSIVSESGDEALKLDGETWRSLLVLRRAVNDRWHVGLDLPLVVQENGIMDGLIDAWHDVSGLPEGERPGMPRNRLGYSYRQAGGDAVTLDNPTSGIGDVRLVATRRLGSAARGATRYAVSAAVELPTGDADDFTGSGGTDWSLGLDLARSGLFDRDDIDVWARAGVTAVGSGGLLDERLRDIVPWGSAAIGWQVHSRVALVAQLDVHRGLYDSGLEELADTAVMLTTGVQIDVGGGRRLDIAIGEDPAVDTAPDIIVHIALRQAATGR